MAGRGRPKRQQMLLKLLIFLTSYFNIILYIMSITVEEYNLRMNGLNKKVITWEKTEKKRRSRK